MPRFALAIVLLLLVSFPASANVQYRVLVPVYFYEQQVPGALGSVWITQIAIHNAGPHEFIIDTCSPPQENLACTLELQHDEQLASGETQRVLPQFRYPLDPDIPGRVLHVAGFQAEADTLSYQLRITDISRLALTAGTEVPVVRERDFRTSTTRLLNVPVDSRFRLTFRLYEMNLRDANFTIRLYDADSGALLVTRDVRVQIRTPQGRKILEPGYFQVNDAASLIPASATPKALRFEIEPRSEGSAFWTFVSITNNETQQFTLVTPQ